VFPAPISCLFGTAMIFPSPQRAAIEVFMSVDRYALCYEWVVSSTAGWTRGMHIDRQQEAFANSTEI
jgi:hypothetical protein